MKYGRTFNFSAGPAMMPEPVLEEIRDEMMNYRGSGMCVMEMSHRSPVFQQIIDEAEQDLRDLMGIPDNYKVLFIQGGATLQFCHDPDEPDEERQGRLHRDRRMVQEGHRGGARRYGEVNRRRFQQGQELHLRSRLLRSARSPRIPTTSTSARTRPSTASTWNKLPNTKGHVLVSDQSSMFLSKPCNVSDYGMIYAGVQKNVGPAGMVVVHHPRGSDPRRSDGSCPSTCSTSTHADAGSMYNTPNCWAIYCCGKVFKYLKSIGGLEEMHKRNLDKAKVFYDFLDSSKMFKGTVEPEFRSLMNIPFVTGVRRSRQGSRRRHQGSRL